MRSILLWGLKLDEALWLRESPLNHPQSQRLHVELLVAACQRILLPIQAVSPPCELRTGLLTRYPATASPRLSASLALECLNSVPLNTELSTAFLEYIFPYLLFQSNQAYLKDLPSGWTLDGVDLFGGLSKISQNLETGVYSNQWQFETDLYTLVNILPRDFHLNLPLPLLDIFYFGTDFSLASVSLDGTSLPEVYSAGNVII